MFQIFDLQNSSNTPASFQLLYACLARFEHDWNSNRHSHECAEIFFCIQGKGDFWVRDTAIPVQTNDFVIIPPFTEHTEHSSLDAPLEYISLGISGIDILFDNLSCGYYQGNFSDSEMLMLTLLSTLIRELEEKSDSYDIVCYNILNILLIQLNRLSPIQTKPSDPTSALPVAAVDHNIFWVKQYIDDNFTKEINLDLLASKINLSKFNLVRKFKHTYGTSPINYMLQRKFDEAKFLLQTTESSIKQISESLGFSSASYFAQSFQKHEGISPSEYRNSCK